MKRIEGVMLTAVLVIGLAVPGFAAKSHKQTAKKFERIVAHVNTLDVPGKTIGITEEKSGASRTIHISAKAASQLHVGDRVRIKLKPGTDQSMGVLVLKPKPVEEAQDAAAMTAPVNETAEPQQ